jgi:hypothetical protein
MAKIISESDIESARPPAKQVTKVVAEPLREDYVSWRHDTLTLHDDLAEKRAELRKKMAKERAKGK